jgi:hypothetical protein
MKLDRVRQWLARGRDAARLQVRTVQAVSSRGQRRRAARWITFVVLALSFFVHTLGPPPAFADPRATYLARLLRTSDSFRVRTQAAISLGRLERDSAATAALVGALDDSHPAVRAAAASSLGRLGDPATLEALRRRRGELDASARQAVRSAIQSLERVARSRPQTTPVPRPITGGRERYYIGVGMPGGTNARLERSVLEAAREFIAGRVGEIDGVVIAPERESTTEARQVLRRRRLTGYFLESSVVKVENRDGGVRAEVSIIVNTYPGRDMRVILNGAATVQGGGTGDASRRQAVEGALSGAFRRLPQALEAADARNGG